jgi:hypothetical protein
MPNIERPEVTAARLGVGLTKFNTHFVDHGDGNNTVPGTDIPRLRPVPLGAGKAIGFVDDETSALIEALRRRRDNAPSPPRAEPKHLRTGRDAYWERWRAKKKRRGGTKRRAEQQDQGGEVQPA